jgi:outer membrane receptor protein involved in Fe transport
MDILIAAHVVAGGNVCRGATHANLHREEETLHSCTRLTVGGAAAGTGRAPGAAESSGRPDGTQRLTAGLDLHTVSSRVTLAQNRADAFTVVNLTLFNDRMVMGLELSGSIYNLFDTRYGYPGGEEHRQDVLPQDGRTARVKLAYRFGGE